MAKLKVLNPVAIPAQHRIDPAPRVKDLAGKRIGLYWNMKVGGDLALRRVEELLRERYPDARFTHYMGDVGWAMRDITPAGADRIAAESDVVIGSTSD